MLLNTILLSASLASLSLAAALPPAQNCKTPTTTAAAVTPTLPTTGGASEVPAPPAGLTLKKIGLGHGIQNYSCSVATGTANATGALAVLYDVTSYYPGQPGSKLNQTQFNSLSSLLLWGQDLPLNLINPAAAKPGTPTKPNVLPEASYGATAKPFKADSDLVVPGVTSVKTLGHHYFNAAGQPTFDLRDNSNIFLVAKKLAQATAPASADKGILSTGAVAWLQLTDAGGSTGATYVYRVITAGGAAQTCDKSGVGIGSVPYTAFYWFFA